MNHDLSDSSCGSSSQIGSRLGPQADAAEAAASADASPGCHPDECPPSLSDDVDYSASDLAEAGAPPDGSMFPGWSTELVAAITPPAVPPPAAGGGRWKRRRSSSLDPLQTNVTEATLAQPKSFRHSFWFDDRARVQAAMASLFVPKTRQDRFECCGDNCWVMQHRDHPSQFSFKSDKCGDRFCFACMQDKSRRVHWEMLCYCKDKKDLSLLTLTMKAEKQSLGTCLKRITKHFRALRALPVWKPIRGGISILELKWSPEKERWHVHLHCIIEASYVEQAKLSHAWLAVTGDSMIVDIRRVGNLSSGLKYVTKYVCKGFGADVIRNDDRLQECIMALSGKRTLAVFGSWRGFKPSETTPENDGTPYNKEDWRPLVPLVELWKAAENGLKGARDALQWLKQGRRNLLLGEPHSEPNANPQPPPG